MAKAGRIPRARTNGGRVNYRYCRCGTVLSTYNVAELCAVCQRNEVRADLMGDNSGLIAQAVRRAVRIYAHPERNASKVDYLQRLTGPLDDLCRALGVEPPRFEGRWVSEGPGRSGKFGSGPSDVTEVTA